MTLTTEEVAAAVGRKPGTIRQWVLRGELTPVRPGTRPLLFREEDVVEVEHRMRSAVEHEQIRRAAARFAAQPCAGLEVV